MLNLALGLVKLHAISDCPALLICQDLSARPETSVEELYIFLQCLYCSWRKSQYDHGVPVIDYTASGLCLNGLSLL